MRRRSNYDREVPTHEPREPDSEPSGDRRYPTEEPDDFSDLEEIDPDDPRWEAFLADDDERDPQPDPNDFWSED